MSDAFRRGGVPGWSSSMPQWMTIVVSSSSAAAGTDDAMTAARARARILMERIIEDGRPSPASRREAVLSHCVGEGVRTPLPLAEEDSLAKQSR
jgi:hypothetical protein